MSNNHETHTLQDIEFKIIYSHRRTLAISVLPDSSVIVRVPFRTSLKRINRLVEQKSSWIIKHRDNYKSTPEVKQNRSFENGKKQLFRGAECVLQIEKSQKAYVRFYESKIELGLDRTDDPVQIKWLLYQGYKKEASIVFPEIFSKVLKEHTDQNFEPSGLVIRTMKRRWGSCSSKGKITLSTELIKLPDKFIEYVIVHELSHLKHHNHGEGFYRLLSELYPDWKSVRKELRKYIQ
jgi:predicted metal-dependent hydrolase